MADLRIVDAPVLLQESITDDVKMPTGGLGNFSIRLGDIVWYVVTKEQLANKSYVDLSSKGVKDSLDEHISDKNNPHKVTKEQVGLGNVDNTADIDKPVSDATKSAIITATNDMATKAYVNSKDNLKADITYVDSKDGDLSALLTTDKTSLVKAINEVVSVKADKATTLLGYGISDAYTKSEIDTDYGGVKTLYDKNVEAGAGTDGWTDQLVKLTSGRTQHDKNSEHISAKDFDAKGDGVVNDTAKLQAAIDSRYKNINLVGGTYLCDTITVNDGVTLFNGTIKLKTANTVLLNLKSNTTLDNLTLIGSGVPPDGSATSERLVSASGTTAQELTNIRVLNCTLINSYGYAVRMDYVANVSCLNNTVRNIRYGGFVFIGGKYIKVHSNRISNITGLVTNYNGYGITFSTDSLVKTTDGGRVSSFCSAIGNIIENIPTWNAIDTHGGQNLVFSNNVIIDCGFPIGVVSSNKPMDEGMVSAKNIIVANNTIEYTSLIPNSKQNTGISVVAETGKFHENVKVVGNVFNRCGIPGNANAGAIKVAYTKNAVVGNNTINQPYAVGICIYGYNYSFSVTGNTITDPQDDTYVAPCGIRTVTHENIGVISGNSIYNSNTPPNSTYVGVTGIAINSANGNDIVFGANYANTTNKVSGYAKAGMGTDLLISELSDSTTGTVNNTMVDVGTVYSQSVINSNFAELTVKYNQLVRILERMTVAG